MKPKYLVLMTLGSDRDWTNRSVNLQQPKRPVNAHGNFHLIFGQFLIVCRQAVSDSRVDFLSYGFCLS